MMRRTLAVGLGLAVSACGGNGRPQVTAAPPAAPVVAQAPVFTPPAPKPYVDPIASLIAASQQHF